MRFDLWIFLLRSVHQQVGGHSYGHLQDFGNKNTNITNSDIVCVVNCIIYLKDTISVFITTQYSRRQIWRHLDYDFIARISYI